MCKNQGLLPSRAVPAARATSLVADCNQLRACCCGILGCVAFVSADGSARGGEHLPQLDLCMIVAKLLQLVFGLACKALDAVSERVKRHDDGCNVSLGCRSLQRESAEYLLCSLLCSHGRPIMMLRQRQCSGACHAQERTTSVDTDTRRIARSLAKVATSRKTERARGNFRVATVAATDLTRGFPPLERSLAHICTAQPPSPMHFMPVVPAVQSHTLHRT